MLVARVNHLAGPSGIDGHPQFGGDVDAVVTRMPA
jgi:hypothetical protein